MFDELFGARDDQAWLRAMVDAEKALAVALAKAGVIPASAAAEISQCPASFDSAELGRAAVGPGNPVVGLVQAMRSRVSAEAGLYVHFGATSQDIMDTAAMLLARDAVGSMLADVDATAAACARLADSHRRTIMIARTLMQHALPTTFGLKCAGWLVALDEAASSLRRLRFSAQLGGAIGTLSVFGNTEVPRLFAAELGLSEPLLPWHTNRTRVGELAGALGVLAGVLGKIALDVTLLAQTEVGEVAEASGGGSSTMPHKQNPVRSVLITAGVKQIPGLVSTILAAMPQEHERAAGAWHAEWETLNSMFSILSTACSRTRDLLTGLRVDAQRMRTNVDMTGGLVMAEAVVTALAPSIGRAAAAGVVKDIASSGRPFREALLKDPRVGLSEADIDKALDPAEYLGSADEFIDRALQR
ncbi:3-carboxy-cis,cis-muconate cycloisomerase [Kibdelosporangium philippinense]|uniref:3-carboxy-cis,cis-muconate cycloisomerase n=1 Tax=Kibdelosporangium philippinense TaxID=211113 RepID=A0ABS8Z217_9PSEU|nr:3-carboxy-cis,cis-muconate cycloisomerase [Kibdelosporangium philippinense]MCE7001402.1 3-carboxy-cis,cis-muconate cycloisomerase [Kibdelosporangium philippinense]